MSKGSSAFVSLLTNSTESPLVARAKIMPSTSPPSLQDFEMPYRNFKSSFARSLSMNNGGSTQCKSLDFAINTHAYAQLHDANNNNSNNHNYIIRNPPNINNNNNNNNNINNHYHQNNYNDYDSDNQVNIKLMTTMPKNKSQIFLSKQLIDNVNVKATTTSLSSATSSEAASTSSSPIPPLNHTTVIPVRQSSSVNNFDLKNNKNFNNINIIANYQQKQKQQQQQQQHQQQQLQHQQQAFNENFSYNTNDNQNDFENHDYDGGSSNEICYEMHQVPLNGNPANIREQQQLQYEQQQSINCNYECNTSNESNTITNATTISNMNNGNSITHNKSSSKKLNQSCTKANNNNNNINNFSSNVVVVWPKTNHMQDFNYKQQQQQQQQQRIYNEENQNHEGSQIITAGNDGHADDDIINNNDDDEDDLNGNELARVNQLPDITAMAVPAPQSALLTTPLSAHIINDHQARHSDMHEAVGDEVGIQHHYEQQQKQPPPPQQQQQNTATNAALNLEALLLQKEIDSMQWQLKQVETNCDMYRAVLQEVARFFDRYNSHKLQTQQSTRTNMERSKSLYHVYSGNDKENTKYTRNHAGSSSSNNRHLSNSRERVQSPTPSYLRARSSTNLIDLKANSIQMTPDPKLKSNEALASPCTYENYKDFTWRRSPRKLAEQQRNQSAQDKAEEKLNREAFRLSRTIQNVLNTSMQQAELTHRNWHNSRLLRTPSVSTIALNTPPIHNSTTLTLVEPHNSDNDSSTSSLPLNTSLDHGKAPQAQQIIANDQQPNNHHPHNGNNNVDIIFRRSNNIRESRLSLRSSTDSSVHSSTSFSATSTTSSSKAETDEDPHGMFNAPNCRPASHNAMSQAQGTASKPFSHGHHHHHRHLAHNLIGRSSLGGLTCNNGFSTEDESGFSSINSFQDIGLPFSSTLLSHMPATDSPRLSLNLNLTANADRRQLRSSLGGAAALSLKSSNSGSNTPTTPSAPVSFLNSSTASTPIQTPNNVVGVPVSHDHPSSNNPHHQAERGARFDVSANSKTRNPAKMHRLSMPLQSSDDSSTVHWV